MYAPYREASGLRVGLRFRPERRFSRGARLDCLDLLIGTGFACGGWALAWAVSLTVGNTIRWCARRLLAALVCGYSLGGLSSLSTSVVPEHHRTSTFGSLQRELGTVETAVCMTIYMGVALEFAPALFERLEKCKQSV